MSKRNENREILVNGVEEYQQFLRKRGLTSIRQLGKLKINETESYERARLDVIKHVVQSGDRMYKLAFKHYGDTRLWWVLAWYNKKPTDFHLKPGDVIDIPLPLKEVLYLATRDE